MLFWIQKDIYFAPPLCRHFQSFEHVFDLASGGGTSLMYVHLPPIFDRRFGWNL